MVCMDRILMIGGTGNVGRLTTLLCETTSALVLFVGCAQGDDFRTFIGDFVSSLTHLEAVVLSFHG
jgi:hypothetical protein